MNGKPSPEQFLAGFPLEMRSIAQTLRELVMRVVPNARESVYTGWRLIGYRAEHQNRDVYFAYIAPSSGSVSLGFEYGILLGDPLNVLQGNGKQVRYVPFRQNVEIDATILAPLIKEALDIAALSISEKQARFLQFEAERDARLSSRSPGKNLP